LFAAYGALVEKPQDKMAQVGDTVEFICSTNETKKLIVWKQTKNLSAFLNPPIRIYGRGKLDSKFASRYSVTHVNGSNYFSSYLRINSVEKSDFGTLQCVDKSGFGDQAEATLAERALQSSVAIGKSFSPTGAGAFEFS
jgi:hypothetical protein